MSETFDYGHLDIVLADYLKVNGIGFQTKQICNGRS